jgi:hypothetical protein
VLDAVTGALISESDPVALITSDSVNEDTTQPRQRIGLSSPLPLAGRTYVGVYGFADEPMGIGRIIAVDSLGHIVSGFNFSAVGTDASPADTFGGSVWNSPATDGNSVYFTTGNVQCDNLVCQKAEPVPDNALSLLRIDKTTGGIIWKFQAVPFALDHDDDWAAGATIMKSSCGELIASVQKDGWAYAVRAGNGAPGAASLQWQFPPTGLGTVFLDAPHGDGQYTGPGAAWGDVLIIAAGGESLVADGVTAGYGRLHALNACATAEQDRVRWIADLDPGVGKGGYGIGTPTVTHGIVYIGVYTSTGGHLVALADPSIAPPAGYRCSDIDYTTESDCTAAGYKMVPIPQVLADVALPDGGAPGWMRSEPVLAGGRVFVGTGFGHVYMLAP